MTKKRPAKLAADDPEPVSEIEEVDLSLLGVDVGTQSRVTIDDDTVKEYAARMEAGDTFPPLDAFFDGDAYWVADGHHRLLAAESLDAETIRCRLHQGGQRDAQLFACGANRDHGLRRTNADKRKAVLTLLEDDEWSKFSDRKIAELCAVSHQFVSDLRSQLSTVDSPTTTRIGRDGKQRPAKRAKAGSTAPNTNGDATGLDDGNEVAVDNTQKRRRKPVDSQTIVADLEAIDTTIDAARTRVRSAKGDVMIRGTQAQVAWKHQLERLRTMRDINRRLRRAYMSRL